MTTTAAEREPLWPAVPAAVALLGCVALTLLLTLHRPGDNWYAALATRSIASGDYRTARLCYQRRLIQDPADDAAALGLARSLRGLGRDAEADELTARLAPLDRPGYAPAQLDVAGRIVLSISQGNADSHLPSLAIRHLQNALASDPRNAEAKQMLEDVTANAPAMR